jgi:hypothetical protein
MTNLIGVIIMGAVIDILIAVVLVMAVALPVAQLIEDTEKEMNEEDEDDEHSALS